MAPPELLEAIRGLILGAEPRSRIGGNRLPWQEFKACIDMQRCWPLTVAAFSNAGWPYSEAEWHEATTASGRSLAACLQLDREAITTSRLLREGGIPFAITKGVAFARKLWPNASWRSYSDIDLVVHRAEIPAAVDLLTANGAHLHGADPAQSGIGRYAKSVTYVTDTGIELDIHMNVCEGPYSFRIPEREFLDRVDVIDIGHADVATLSTERLFLHACIHALLPSDQRRLVPMTDVAMGTASNELDAEAAITTANHWGVKGVMAQAIRDAKRTFDLPSALPLVAWAERYHTTLRDRRWLAAYHTPGLAGVVLITLCKVEAQTSWSDRRDYVRFLARRPDGGLIARAREMRHQLTGR